MKAARVTFTDKLALQYLYHQEVNELKAAINDHADLLDNGAGGTARLYQGLTLADAQAALKATPPTVVPGLLYGISGEDWNKSGSPSTVYVRGNSAGAFGLVGELLTGGVFSLVLVDVAAGTAMPVGPTEHPVLVLDLADAQAQALAGALPKTPTLFHITYDQSTGDFWHVWNEDPSNFARIGWRVVDGEPTYLYLDVAAGTGVPVAVDAYTRAQADALLAQRALLVSGRVPEYQLPPRATGGIDFRTRNRSTGGLIAISGGTYWHVSADVTLDLSQLGLDEAFFLRISSYASNTAWTRILSTDSKVIGVYPQGTAIQYRRSGSGPADLAVVTISSEYPSFGYSFVPTALKTAVAGGAYDASNRLTSTPAGSVATMQFFDSQYLYVCFLDEQVNGGALTYAWFRVPRAGGGGGGGATYTAGSGIAISPDNIISTKPAKDVTSCRVTSGNQPQGVFVGLANASGQTIVNFDTIVEDAGANFNVAGNYYTVPIAGKYHIIARLRWSDGIAGGLSYAMWPGLLTDDASQALFGYTNSVRSALLNVYEAHFAAGAKIYQLVYPENFTAAACAEMTIRLIRAD